MHRAVASAGAALRGVAPRAYAAAGAAIALALGVRLVLLHLFGALTFGGRRVRRGRRAGGGSGAYFARAHPIAAPSTAGGGRGGGLFRARAFHRRSLHPQLAAAAKQRRPRLAAASNRTRSSPRRPAARANGEKWGEVSPRAAGGRGGGAAVLAARADPCPPPHPTSPGATPAAR